jgi:hypothetical protein
VSGLLDVYRIFKELGSMSIQRFTILASCVVMGVLLMSWNSWFHDVASAEQNQPAADAKSARAMLEAATKVYREYAEMAKAGVVTGKGNDVEFLYQWSRRWLDSERSIDKATNKQVASFEGHLSRMSALEARCRSQVKAGMAFQYELSAVEFFRIEAEQWLAEAKGR